LKARNVIFGVALVWGLLPLANTVHMVRDWWGTRAGKTEAEQLRELRLPWCRPSFTDHLDQLLLAIPEDAAILCTPVSGDDKLGRSRWFLFLADALYPRRVFVREPAFASGTLVTYPKWVDHHFEVIDTDGTGLSTGGYIMKAKFEDAVIEELEERGVEWELRYAMVPKGPFRDAVLLHNGVVVDYIADEDLKGGGI
jgi:hypothetical protein